MNTVKLSSIVRAENRMERKCIVWDVQIIP